MARESHPCRDRHPELIPDQCGLCWAYVHRADMRAAWDTPGGPAVPVQTLPPVLPAQTPALAPPGAVRAAPDLSRWMKPRCKHRGEKTGEHRPCQGCGNKGRVADLYQCGKHGLCVIGISESVQGAVSCQRCGDHEPEPPPTPPEIAKPGQPVPDPATPDGPEIVPGVPDPIPDPELRPVPPGWATRRNVRDRHIEAFRGLLQVQFPGPSRAEGDGVVICGGGRYWPMSAVSARMLRDVCGMRVQIWYRGEAEPIDPEDLAGVPGIELIDATRFRPAPRILRGWEVKLLALLHCGFRRVLFLDADAYVLRDPTPLLDLASTHRFVYWADLPNTDAHVNWEHFGLDAATGRRVPQVQGGQLALDRLAFWRELVLTHWLCQHSDYSFSGGFGDQDQWRVALAGTGGHYHCLGAAPWIHPAFVCSQGGKPIVVHRPQGKWWGRGQDRRADHLPEEGRAWAHLQAVTWGAGQSARDVFGRICRRRLWGGDDASGAGSTPAEATPYLECVNSLIRLAGWRRVVDLGCGTGAVAREIDCEQLVGVDCHAPLIERLKTEQPDREWLCLDLDRDREQLPAGDVALVKDVLHHWPSALVRDWLEWARQCGKWKWLVLTQDRKQDRDGADCPLGGYRALDPVLRPLREIPGLRRIGEYLHKAVLILPGT